MNWRQVTEHAAELGARRMLYLGLVLASDLPGAQLPQQVTRDIASDGAVRGLAAEVVNRLFRRQGPIRPG